MANEVEKLPGQETNARVSTPILTFRDKIGDLARPNPVSYTHLTLPTTPYV